MKVREILGLPKPECSMSPHHAADPGEPFFRRLSARAVIIRTSSSQIFVEGKRGVLHATG